MEKLTYGDNLSVDFAALPEASQFALAQRGFTHIFGNEVASRVHSWAGAEEQANSDDKATIKAWKDANPDKLAAQAAIVQADMLKALNEGTLGARVSGPRLTPLDTMRRKIAREQIENILRTNKIKVPKKDDKIKMPDGEFTMEELIVRRLVLVTVAKPDKPSVDIGAQITKEAEKRIAAQAKQMAANTSLEDL